MLIPPVSRHDVAASSAPHASRAFYGQLFGWTATDTGEEYGGYINFAKDGSATWWSQPWRPDDADATLAQAVELGGSITRPAEATPYGRLAELGDPTGTPFKIIQP